MSFEAYNKFATAVKEEMSLLNYEEQLGILTIVVNAMNSRKKMNLLFLMKKSFLCMRSSREA